MNSQRIDENTARALEGGDDPLAARLERHALLGTLATRFLATAAEGVDAAIDEALEAIARFAGVDRAGISLFDERGERFTVVHEWHRDTLWPVKGFSEHVALFGYGPPRLLAGQPVAVLDPETLASVSPNEAMLLRGLGVNAMVSVPIRRDDRVIGFTSISSSARRSAPWPAGTLELLQLPGRMLVHALGRSVAEKKLRDSQARWHSICESSVVGVYTIRPTDGAVVESNEAGLRMLGRTREELALGIRWEEISPPEERENDVRMFGILLRSGRVLPWEKQGLRADGSRIPMLTSLTSLAPKSDEMLSFAIDLSSQRRVADELRRRDDIDRLHASLSRRLVDLAGTEVASAVAEALGEVALRLGFDGVAIYDVDPATRDGVRRSWWTRPALAGMRPIGRIPLETHAWWNDRLRAGRIASVAGLATMPEEAAVERASLERAGLESCISVPLLPGGTLRGFLLFFSRGRMQVADDLLATLRVFGDIVANAHERVRIDTEIADALAALERRVEQRRSQLEASNAELEAFAYSVSHDLRAPLRTIDGMCQVLREDWPVELGSEALDLLERIQGATRRMGHLIDGLLQLSRVVRTSMEWKPVNVSDLVEGVADELRRRNPARSVQVRVAPGMSTVGHPGLLRIAFEEVLENAFKFTSGRADATIDVDAVVAPHPANAAPAAAEAADGATGETPAPPHGPDDLAGDPVAITFRVRDNGVGFDADLAEKLFGAFQRLHRPEEFEGHGIGLATVERVVRMHGGSARAEGRAGHGATVLLTIPRHMPVATTDATVDAGSAGHDVGAMPAPGDPA